MKNIFFVFIFISALMVVGCATTQKNKTPGVTTYMADLNGDGSNKVVELEDKTVTGNGSGTEVTVYSRGKEKKKIDSISLPGKFTKVDFIQLNPSNSQQQIAVYSRVEGNATNLVVYRLQNNIFSKMFDATSEYGIDLDNMGVITRIKIGRARDYESINSPNRVHDWESWVWTGDKFIKE
jgi:hypothetical protein